jgi:molybdopterin-guanine dinucleotide biosynthesis protein B
MKVFGIVGHSGMGKTTLLEKLIPALTSRGLTVSLIKHSHKYVDIDRPGKDSFRLREAGCSEVLLLGHGRWALMHELRDAPEPPLEELLARLEHCDLVLIEGFKLVLLCHKRSRTFTVAQYGQCPKALASATLN